MPVRFDCGPTEIAEKISIDSYHIDTEIGLLVFVQYLTNQRGLK